MSEMIKSALLKEQLKRFWAISVLGILVYVFFVLFPLYSAVSNENHNQVNRQLSDILNFGHLGIIFLQLITPLVAVFCVKGYFTGKNPATFFYALPLSKRQLFFTNTLAGVILCVIPLVVLSLGLLAPIEFYDVNRSMATPQAFDWHQHMFPPVLFPGGVVDGGVINTPAAVGIFFLRALTITLFYFGLFWLAFSLSGHGVVAVLLSGALPLLVVMLPTIFGGVAQAYVFGYVYNEDLFQALATLTTPALWGALRSPETAGQLVAAFANYIVLGAAIYIGAYFVSQIRKPERTGNSVVFVPVKNACIFILSLGAMLIIGALLWNLNFGLWLYVGFVIGFSLGYIIAQMIAEKTFNVVDKMKQLPVFGAVAVGLYLVTLVFTQFGMGGYVNHQPARNEIVGVHVGWRNLQWYDPERDQYTFTGDPAAIEGTLQVHRNILDNRSSLHAIPAMHNSRFFYERYGSANARWESSWLFNYLLADGSVMTRLYSIPFDYMEPLGLSALLESEPIILSNHMLLTRPEVILNVHVRHSAWEEEVTDSWSTRGELTSSFNLTVDDREVIDKLVDFAIEALVAGGAVDRRFAHWGWGGWDDHDEESATHEIGTIIVSEHTDLSFQVDMNHPQMRRFLSTWVSLTSEDWERLQVLLEEWGVMEDVVEIFTP